MFIFSVGLHVEIGRQIKLNSNNIAIKNKVKKYSLSNFRDKTRNMSILNIHLKKVLILMKYKRTEKKILKKEKMKSKKQPKSYIIYI